MCCAGSNIAADNMAIYCKRMRMNVLRVYARALDDPTLEYMRLEDVKSISLAQIIEDHLKDDTYVRSKLLDAGENQALKVYVIGENVYQDWAKM